MTGRDPDALPLTLPVPLTPEVRVALPLGVREAQEEAQALGDGDEDGVAVAQPEELGEEVEDREAEAQAEELSREVTDSEPVPLPVLPPVIEVKDVTEGLGVIVTELLAVEEVERELEMDGDAVEHPVALCERVPISEGEAL